MYMSYCRFEGTLAEMRACIGSVEEHVNEEAEYEVSEREIDCFRKMVQEFAGWLYDMELLDENGELDETELDNVCESMARGYAKEDE